MELETQNINVTFFFFSSSLTRLQERNTPSFVHSVSPNSADLLLLKLIFMSCYALIYLFNSDRTVQVPFRDRSRSPFSQFSVAIGSARPRRTEQLPLRPKEMGGWGREEEEEEGKKKSPYQTKGVEMSWRK